MIKIIDIGIIIDAIYTLYNILKDKSKNRDNSIKIGIIILFFLIILKLILKWKKVKNYDMEQKIFSIKKSDWNIWFYSIGNRALSEQSSININRSNFKHNRNIYAF